MKKKLLAIALSTIGAVGAVQAGAVAQSSLEILGLTLFNVATGITLDVSQFDVLQIVDTTNLNPTVTPGGANPFTAFSVGGAPLSLNVVCFPVACPAGLTAPGPFGIATTGATSNGALGASQLENAPITGLPTPYAGGVNARTNAVAERVSPGTANTSSSLSVATQFSFSLLNNLNVGIQFSAIDHLLAFLDSQTNALAGSAWNVHITNHATGATVFDWTPNGLLGGITGGTELLDPCSLTRSIPGFGPSANVTYLQLRWRFLCNVWRSVGRKHLRLVHYSPKSGERARQCSA